MKKKMMKAVVSMAMTAVVMTLPSCGTSNEYEAEAQGDTLRRLTVTFSVEGGTRSTSLTSENLTDLWVFDYVGDNLVQTLHQASTDDGFGSVSMNLKYGGHRLCFVASRGQQPVVDSDAGTITWERPSDTFWLSEDVNVVPGDDLSVSAVLRRVATRLRVCPTDIVTATMAKFVMEPATWYYGLDVRTGSGVSPMRKQREIVIPQSNVGQTMTCVIFGLSPSAGWSTDVSVSLLANDGTTLGHVDLHDAPFTQNVTTTFRGSLVEKSVSSPVQINGDWEDDAVVNW